MGTKDIGNKGEDFAASFLVRRGYEILERNFRCKLGEIDLIAKYGRNIIFVEVKYRKNRTSGFAEEAVNYKKIRKICATADYYRMINNLSDRWGFRFDIIAINETEISHLKNAFSYVGRY